MKKFTKKILEIEMVLLVFGAFLFAQGSKETVATGTSQEREKITLTWLNHYQEAGKQAWVEHCKQIFEEKYPNVTLTIETVGADSYPTLLQAKLASDDAPSLFDLASNHDVTIYEKAGHLADLSGQPCLKEVDPELLKEGQVDGKQMGVPIEVSGYAVFYNKDVFDTYGLKEPKTLSELKTICQKLMENGVQPFAAPFAEQWAFRYYLRAIVDITCVMPNHTWYADKMNAKSTFSSDQAFKDALGKYFSFHAYWGDDPFGTSWDDAQNMIANGKAAMCIHGSWAVDGFTSHNPNCTIGVFPMPVDENPDDCFMIKEPGQQLVLHKENNAKKMAAEYDLYNIIYSSECMKSYAEDAHQIPSVSGEYKMLPALKKIMTYPSDKSFMESGVPAYTSEYEDVFFENLAKYSMGDAFDTDGFCTKVDEAFAAIKK